MCEAGDDTCARLQAIDRSAATIDFDVDGVILEVNENYLALTGYAREELIGRHHSLFVPPEEIASGAYEAFWAQLLQGSHHSAEYRRVGKGGRVFWIRGAYTPILSEGGEVLRILKYAMDITERKEIELELERASEAKDLFLANMSHEIRTPLNGVVSLSELLRRTRLTRHQTRMVDMIEGSGVMLEKILGDLVNVAGVEAGRMRVTPAPVDIRKEVETAVFPFLALSAQKGLRLSVDVDRSVPASLFADGPRLRQILTNLLSNACKFTDAGSVRLRCHYVREGPEGALHISVRDTGIGIEPAKLEAVLKPFVQADPSIRRRFGGSGLGLSIVRTLVEAMNGELELESAPGQGLVVRIRLPLAPGEPAAVGVRPEAGPAGDRALRALVVDDNPSNRTILNLILAPWGFACESAENGLEALDRVEREPFDCIFMDLHMPEMDGLEATRMIRALESEGRIGRTRIVMVTANDVPRYRAEALSAGADIVITKPIRISQLSEALASLF